ncbi:MAG: GxxExxY protein [Verrucomicrobia bacterium]|nr:GxxExxY protein [Verrucomicrobiota bacterium]
MPIECGIEPRRLTRDQNHDLDYQVTGLAFDLHGRLGRLHDEKIYQVELASACDRIGLPVRTEVPLRLSFGDYEKPYFMDLVVDDALMYGLKTTESLNRRHHGQALNYLLLSGLIFGKLLNFRPPSVKYHFVTTTLSVGDRHDITIEDDSWTPLNEVSARLRELMGALLQDWGGFLDASIYFDAICHFLGGIDAVVSPVSVRSSGRSIGHERFALLTDDVAFEITCLKDYVDGFESHLRRKIEHTPLKAVEWINLEGHIVTFKTVFAPSAHQIS